MRNLIKELAHKKHQWLLVVHVKTFRSMDAFHNENADDAHKNPSLLPFFVQENSI